MVTRKSYCTITTLCKPDDESIRKIVDAFNTLVREAVVTDPDYIRVKVTPRSVRTVRPNVGGKELDLRRITWDVDGERDILERFFQTLKTLDKNPYQHFTIRENYWSLDNIIDLMNIRETN